MICTVTQLRSFVVGLPAEEAGHDDYEIEVMGETVPATRHARALYDPKRERILA